MKIVAVSDSAQWRMKVHSILEQMAQTTKDDLQWLTINQAWDRLREEGRSWDLTIVELPENALLEEPQRWRSATWVVPSYKSASFGVFAVSASDRSHVLACYSGVGSIPDSIRDCLRENEVALVELKSLTRSEVERLRRERRRARVPDVVSAVQWLQSYHAVDLKLPRNFEIPKDISLIMNDEVPLTRIQSEILAATLSVFGLSDFSAAETVLIAMQTARYLAGLEIEGNPYEMTLAIGSQEKMGELLIEPNSRLTIGLQSSTLSQLEEICELAQGPDTCLFIDGFSGVIRGIVRADRTSDLGKISGLISAAKQLEAILLRLPGNGTTVLVAPDRVICEHNGSNWGWWRFRRLVKELDYNNYTTDLEGLDALLEALDHLSFHRLSSIVGIAKQPFSGVQTAVALERMRSMNLPYPLELKTLTPMTLASFLRLDGLHLIFLNEKGRLQIEDLARGIVPPPKGATSLSSQASGMGRTVAAVLSAAYPAAVVCKISASGGSVIVYCQGQRMRDMY